MTWQNFIGKDKLLYLIFSLALICLVITCFSAYQNVQKIENQKKTSLKLMITKGTVVSNARIMQMSAGLFIVTKDQKWYKRANDSKSNFQKTLYKFKNTKLNKKSRYYLKEIDEFVYQFEETFDALLQAKTSKEVIQYDQLLDQQITSINDGFADLLLHLNEEQLLIQRQAEIVQNDEILSMSAFIASYDTTNLNYWEEKYMHSDQQLAKAFENLTFALKLDQTSITSETNDKLLETEKLAFAAIRNKQSSIAKDKLFSEDYQQLKDQYNIQTGKANSIIEHYLSMLQSKATRPFKLLMLLGLLLIFALVYFAYKIAQSEKQVEIKTEENYELEQYSRIVSHDLKAPLRNISGFLTLLQRKEGDHLSNESLEYIDIVKDQTVQMSNMINGILKLSQVSKNESTLEKISVTKQLKLITEPFLADNRTIKFKLPKKEIDMTCSKIRFSQIFQNLISNAVKYSDKDVVHIDITAKETNEQLTFNIKDNGPGIKKEYAERIFGLFQTLGPKSKENTGLGLAIVKKVVESVGGRIRLLTNDQTEEGANFELTLPRQWS